MKYASVCSGVEAASLAWGCLGWEPAWFSEIEPFPCAVLKERFPHVPNLGDMTKIKVENLKNGDQRFTDGNGAVVDVPGGVDLLVGGTPCQGFSVAGKQGGLQDDRSVLCLTFCQLLADMQPRWFVWENVPGVFSTGGGEDFKAFLRKVNEVGYCCGWRVLDAQYTRVDGFPRAIPQRRRRVFVIGHLGDEWQYPAEVLFEPTSMPWNTPPRRIKGKGFAGNAEGCVGDASRINPCGEINSTGNDKNIRDSNTREGTSQTSGKSPSNNRPFDGYKGESTEFRSSQFGEFVRDTVAGTIKLNSASAGNSSITLVAAGNDQAVFTTAMSIGNGQVNELINDPELAQTLNCMHDQQAVLCLNDQGGSVMQVERDGNAGTLRANTHGNEQIVCVHGSQDPCCNSDHANSVQLNNGLENVVCYENHANDSRITESNDVSPLISSRAGTGGNNLPLVQECFVKTSKPKFKGDCETYVDTGVAPTVNCFDQGEKRANELVCESIDSVENIIGMDGYNSTLTGDVSSTIGVNAGMSTGRNGVVTHATVRRLLPVECERLMGFPDNWTRIPWKGKLEEDCPDSPRYKACGNSMCVNVMRWIGMRIERVERRMKGEEK